MNPSQLFEPVQKLFDAAKAQGRVTQQTRFLFFKSLVAKTNLAPSGPIVAADMHAVASTSGKLSTYRLFLLQALPEHGPHIYRATMVEHLFANEPPSINDAVYEVDAAAGMHKQRLDLNQGAANGEEVARTLILPFLQSTQILDGDAPAQPILNMVTVNG